MGIIRQNSFNGGLADSLNLGVKGSFYEGKGMDIHSEPGVLKVNQTLKKESGTTVTAFIKCKVQASDGNTYFGDEGGNIYKRTSTGSWSSAYTDGGHDAILGIDEFDGYLYWATDDKLHRMITAGDWSGDVANDWATFANGDSAYHPMIDIGLYLFIGDGRAIASVDDSGTFTANGTPEITFLSLPHRYRARCFFQYGIDLLIGSWIDNSTNKARIFRWDTVSASYSSTDDINEVGVNAFIPIANSVFAQCGKSGNFYFYDGEKLTEPPAKKLRGEYTTTKYMEVYPEAVANLKGLTMFGVSNGYGNPLSEGVYSLGRYDKNYPLALNLEYPISPNVVSDIEIGVVHEIGSDLLVSWRDNTSSPTISYGVDVIDYTAKYASPYITTINLASDRYASKSFNKYILSYSSKPTGTDVELSYLKNTATPYVDLTPRDKTDEQQLEAHSQVDTGLFQIKIEPTVSGNDAPEIDELAVNYKNKLV